MRMQASLPRGSCMIGLEFVYEIAERSPVDSWSFLRIFVGAIKSKISHIDSFIVCRDA